MARQTDEVIVNHKNIIFNVEYFEDEESKKAVFYSEISPNAKEKLLREIIDELGSKIYSIKMIL